MPSEPPANAIAESPADTPEPEPSRGEKWLLGGIPPEVDYGAELSQVADPDGDVDVDHQDAATTSEQAEEPEQPSSVEVESKPDAEPDTAPLWATQMLEMQATQHKQFLELMERFAPSKAPKAEPEPKPEPLQVESVIAEGLRAKGIDPESHEGRVMLEAYGLHAAREFFPEEQRAQIDSRLEKANRTARKLTENQKLRAEITELRERLDGRDVREAREPVFERVARDLVSTEAYRADYPRASVLGEKALRRWLGEEIKGKPTADSLRGAVEVLDDMLAQLGVETAADARALHQRLVLSRDPRRWIVEAYATGLDSSAQPDSAPEHKAAPSKPKRPSAPRAMEGNTAIKAGVPRNRTESWLFGDREQVDDDARRRADAEFSRLGRPQQRRTWTDEEFAAEEARRKQLRN